ncbi:hypothetical protein R5R35_001351 [Gryllus longicercus]|uniref:DUF2428 domain-containing protein n=1 Tax=Gryllus longicercus TaxID=2509291 RepID=A0AAN9VH08_9ORTH
MDGSFKNDAVTDVIKLGLGKERPQVDSFIMPVAATCLPMLFAFLAEGSLQTVEDLLLCADAAASLLGMFPPDMANTVVTTCLRVGNEPNTEVDFSEGDTQIFLKLVVAKPLTFKLCMCRGLLRNQYCLTPSILGYMAPIISTACYQFSPFTCLGFRTLHMWISYWQKMDYYLDSTVSENIYTIVVGNWENPVPGVRKENVKVLCALLEVAGPSSRFSVEELLQHVMKDMSWKMKSKYFLLAVLIPKHGVLRTLEKFPGIVSALVATLGINRLSPAGAEVYRVCLAAFTDVDAWCCWFLQPLLALLTSQREQDRLAQLSLLMRWLPPTLRKFPVLTEIMNNELLSNRNENLRVDVALSALIHQARKEGYVAELWPQFSFIESFLVDGDEEVRKHAFGAICKKTKKSAIPPAEEFEAVKKFLKENVNVDSSTLRQSIVNSFSHFLERMYESCAKHIEGECSVLKPNLSFLHWMHKFLLGNLKLGGNYQRIVTSLQLYLEILKRFGPSDTNKPSTAETIRSLAKGQGMWAFETEESWHVVLECVLCPTEDIQKTAAEILSKHLKLLKKEGALSRLEYLWTLTLRQCRSAIFYEAESGSLLMKLIVHFLTELPHLSVTFPHQTDVMRNKERLDMLLKTFSDFSVRLQVERSESTAKTTPKTNKPNEEMQNAADTKHCEELRPLITFWQLEVEHQWISCRKDVFRAMTCGAALHGALGASVHLAPYFTQEDVALVLLHLNRIVDYFLSLLSGQEEDCCAVSPSFAEMTLAINKLVPEEDLESCPTQLSPGHQLTLSCVWLTLKESCALAATLVCNPNASGLDVVRCLMIVEKVLLRCRHKGTIEAAGASFAVMVRHVTRKEETRKCLSSFLPECGEKLVDFLQDMLERVLVGIATYSNQTSITRQSAGIAILVQKIIAADARPDKPLLRVCLRGLCEAVESPPPLGHALEECDLPQACALHLLSRLAQDASLRLELLPYASATALLCVDAFSSANWTVQNAALQLFGVLLPLIVGEKKVQDDDTEIYGNLTTEEFLAHYPSLTTFFLDEMKKTSSQPDMFKYIVPILSFLSKLTYGDCWSADNCGLDLQYFLKYMVQFMKCPELAIRKTAAKCYSRFIPKNKVYATVTMLCTELKEAGNMSENEIHGKLAALQQLIHRLIEEGTDVQTFRHMRHNLQVPLPENSYINKSIHLEIMHLIEIHCNDYGFHDYLKLVREVIVALNKKSFRDMLFPGIHSWAIQGVKFASTRCREKELCSIWTTVYANDWDILSDTCVCAIKSRIPNLSESTKEELTNTLVSCVCNGWTKEWDLLSSIFLTLLELTSTVNLMTTFRIIHNILTIARKEECLVIWSISLPLACKMFASNITNFHNIPQSEKEFLKVLAEEALARTAADEWDVDVRFHAAESFVVLFQGLSCLHSQDKEIENVPLYVDIVSTVLDCGLALLQDEDPVVRSEASKFVSSEQNPYVCLLTLLRVEGLLGVLSHYQIARYFLKKLLDTSSLEAMLAEAECEMQAAAAVKSSPFEHGTSNIYAEEAQVLRAMAESLLELLQLQPCGPDALPAFPKAQDLEVLVTKLLHHWKGMSSSPSEAKLLLLKLEILSQLEDKITDGSSIKEYSKLAEMVKSSLRPYKSTLDLNEDACSSVRVQKQCV